MTFAQPFTDYELLDRVGAGAMGTVFKAKQKRLGRIVALKVLKPSLARDERYVDRLKREARIVASLNHPHIVTGYDLGEENGFHYFVMEFVEGRSLRQLLAEWGMFPEQQVLKVGLQTAQALDHAYQRGVIHRDVKPGNILIDESGKVKLTDMGLAKGPADLTLTRDGATVGTPQYISPEQARNPQDVDVRSDLYSLGATLYHMATGVPPFAGATMAEVITKVLHDAPVAPRDLNPALSEGLSLVIRKLLAKDLRVRYQTPRELLDDLERVQRAMPPAVDESRLAASERGPQPSVVLRSLVVTAVCAAILGAVWFGTQLGGNREATPQPAEFLAQLDADLQALTKPGEKWARLRKAHAAPPDGVALELQRLDRAVLRDLQRAVDEVASRLLGPERQQMSAWLRDPSRWPDRAAAFEHGQLLPRLRHEVGLVGELPADLGRGRIDELLRDVTRELQSRDADFLARLDEHLKHVVDRVEARLREGDFAGATKLIAGALKDWCDGVQRPLLERLSPATASEARAKYRAAEANVTTTITARETAVAANLVAEARAACEVFEEQLREGMPSEQVQASVERTRSTLQQVYPVATRFRVGNDPWPGIDADFAKLKTRIGAASEAEARRRIELRCDLAWRAVCFGEPADGLAVLQDLPGEAESEVVAQNRDAIAAAQQVHDAILRVLEKEGDPVRVFPRSGSGEPVELRVVREDGKFAVRAQAFGRPARQARLTEFRFDDLLTRLLSKNPFAHLAPAVRDKGCLVLAMVSDEFTGVGERLSRLGVEERAQLDEMWARIERLRGPDRAALAGPGGEFLRRLEQEWQRAKVVKDAFADLEKVVDGLQNSYPELLHDPAANERLRAVVAWMQLERRRRTLEDAVQAAAPIGAEFTVLADGGQLQAQVKMSAQVLHRDAKERWQLRDGLLTFTGSPPPWTEQWLDASPNRLDVATALEDEAGTLTVKVEIALPKASLDERLYLFDYRGIGILLALTGDDMVKAAVVDGDLRKEETSHRAFLQALEAPADRSAVVAIPDAVHLLEFEFVTAPSGRRTAVTVKFEKRTLCEVQRDVDLQRPARLSLYPRQQVSIGAIEVRAQIQ